MRACLTAISSHTSCASLLRSISSVSPNLGTVSAPACRPLVPAPLLASSPVRGGLGISRSIGSSSSSSTMSEPSSSMEGAPAQPRSFTPSPKAAIDFLMLLTKLKVTPRTGWVRKGVDGPESIADHMYRMGMMALVAGDAGVDSNRCIRMAIVHDVAESIVGDITPHCKVSNEEKHRLELGAIEKIQEMLGSDSGAAAEVASLWHEYEGGSTPEAQLVKDFDKLEMIIQAFEYEQAQDSMHLQEFFDTTVGKFKTPLGQAWAKELIDRRTAASKR